MKIINLVVTIFPDKLEFDFRELSFLDKLKVISCLLNNKIIILKGKAKIGTSK